MTTLDEEPSTISMLVKHLPTTSASAIKYALRLVDHRLVCEKPSKAIYAGLVELLGEIIKRVKTVAGAFLQEVKEFMFKLEGVRKCCRTALPEAARTGWS